MREVIVPLCLALVETLAASSSGHCPLGQRHKLDRAEPETPGLSLVVGLVLYISSINDEVMNRPSGSEQYFHYRYGWSFAFAASSFLLKEGAGVMSVYLFTKRYAEEEMYRPHPAFYRPRLSDCSDYSGQFLHPEVWHRGRSPSDISSDVSIQMTQNYPPAIKYPEHMHISTSPC
ncbi:voltage-dependent calcium channel gamma-7 subunit-like [Chelonoidis abingdonii]|uniref:voltage-dependent calcium channel gamma-7 subunit-like n=1 Tax=Chelonoidis abingdonii TaxID=106734 RepID=UPI003F495F62